MDTSIYTPPGEPLGYAEVLVEGYILTLNFVVVNPPHGCQSACETLHDVLRHLSDALT
jgi:hypothetical protein